jgi:hypothetical protein
MILLAIISFGYVATSTGNKIKNKMGLYQTKVFLHSQGSNQQDEKTTYGMGGNICKSYI